MSTAVVKIGTSSITDDVGVIDRGAIAKLCDEVADARSVGRRIVVVTSGAIAAGLPELGLGGEHRPRDAVTLQAVSAVGQANLVQVYKTELGRHGLVAGQVLLAPLDFVVRAQYLQARGTLNRLLELGVVPVVNENDAIADDEIRFGDNDRLAALVAHLVEADDLVLLTDTVGVLTADPRRDATASLIEEIIEVDHQLELVAGGAGSARGSGGMASKLAAAKMASWSGVRTVIAQSSRPDVVADALSGEHGVGTVVHPVRTGWERGKLWIAFAVAAVGRVGVDDGARDALTAGGRSLLAAGVRLVDGDFDAGDAVEVTDEAGTVFAKGLVGQASGTLREIMGRRSADLPDGVAAEVIHRDDLVLGAALRRRGVRSRQRARSSRAALRRRAPRRCRAEP